MEKTVERTIKRYLKQHFPNEWNTIVNKAHALYPELMSKAPALSGITRRPGIVSTARRSTRYSMTFITDTSGSVHS